MTDDWMEYLDSLAVFGMKPGLERVEALLDALGHPECAFRSVHIVGTNGKSSTARYAAAVLSAHGLAGAAYLSPHISGYPERLQLDGSPVDSGAFGHAVERVRTAADDLPFAVGEATQFEVLTVSAFLAMAEAGVQAAAVEAGLGGRLDATNVLRAPVVALTNIGLEHTGVLGDTREQIFAEKAAVIASGADAVFGELEGLEDLAAARCAQVGARPHYVGRDVLIEGGPGSLSVRISAGDRRGSAACSGPHDAMCHVTEYGGLRLPTEAAYQATNAGLAVAACHYLLGELRPEAVRRGLAAAAVPGRLQIVRRRPLVIADGAHNPHGAAAMAASLAAIQRPRPRVALLAVMADKAVDDMLRVLLPLADAVVCTRAREPRSLAAEALATRVAASGFTGPAEPVDDAREAYRRALARAGEHGSVLVTGSLYLLEDLAGDMAVATG